MATKTWIGKAAKVAQVTKVVFSTVAAGATYSLTINGKSVSVTTTTTLLADLVALFVGAWSSSAEPEHQEVSLAGRMDPTLSGVQLTANTAGVPFVVTAAATSGTATVTEPVSAAGPNFWNAAANWSGGTLPAAGDDLVLSNSNVSVLYGLVDATNYASLTIEASFTGAVGLPSTNARGYPEYRTQYLTLGSGSAIAVSVGYGSGAFPSLVRLNFGTSAVTYTQFGSAAASFGASASGVEVISNASSGTFRVYGGTLSVGSTASATITVLDVIVQDGTSVPGVTVSNAVTVTTATIIGGLLTCEGAVTTLVAREGAKVATQKASASQTVRVGSRSSVDWESSGGITTKLIVESGGVINFGGVGTTKTVAACDLFAGGTLLDPLDKVTFSTGIVLQACRLGDVTLDVGLGVTINA